MVTVTKSTTRTVSAKNGYLVPATVDQRTELNDLPIAECIYARLNAGKANRATLGMVMDAVRDASAIVIYYTGADGKQDARVLWPNSVTLTKNNDLTARCYCTLRREWRSFRIDRMNTCHPLTTPDDALTDDEPHQDWEDSPQGRAIAAR